MNAQAIAQIANYLNVSPNQIKRCEEWASVLFVQVHGCRPRFVSKKVVQVEDQQVVYVTGRGKQISIRPSGKGNVEVNGKRCFVAKDSLRYALVDAGVPSRDVDALIFDIQKMMSVKEVSSTATKTSAKPVRSQLNPQWVIFNNCINEGGEGYNPYPKYL